MDLYIDGSVLFDGQYTVNLVPSSKCALMLCKYPNTLTAVKVNIVLSDNEYSLLHSDDINHYESSLRSLDYDAKIIKFSQLIDDYKVVDLPLSVSVGKFLIHSGPAAVYRSLVQYFYKPGEKIPVFGTAQSCLKACKERSKWTLMCEKTIIDLISSYICDGDRFNDDMFSDLSASFIIHKSSPLNAESRSKKNLHKFLEGPRKTLSDIIISFFMLDFSLIDSKFSGIVAKYPVLFDWLNLMRLDKLGEITSSLRFLPISWDSKESRLQTNDDHTFSIIKGLEKMTVSIRNTTELRDLLSVSEIAGLKINFSPMEDLAFDWSGVPELLRPYQSQIPAARQQKKSDQLINMVSIGNRVIQPGMTVIDFCSGGGHLGLMVAAMHPECRVVLLENKEESLSMAESRISQSGLSNVRLYQCNIFAFKGHFDVGLALHACGSVTDLVMEICASRGAHMVISPCCHGSIAPNGNIGYPRSHRFSEHVPLDVYSKLSHAADCFNAKPARIQLGNEAMSLIDSDRAQYAAEHGYAVEIFKMVPADCTPKNHVLFFKKN